MRQATLVFLIERNSRGKITKVLLAMKKRGFGKGRYNGVGGKPEKGETIKQCAKREAKEEIGVEIEKLNKVGKIKFRFKNKKEFDQDVHFFTCEMWQGTPTESEEMKPRWFSVHRIPFSKMWPDDKYWMPLMIKDKKFTGSILFGKNDEILENKIQELEKSKLNDRPIICSACLLGLATRYDGKIKPNKKVLDLAKNQILIPVCPEQLGGQSTPRKDTEIKGKKIIEKDGGDVTKEFVKGAKEVLKIAKLYKVKNAILKQRSPSCGCGKIYDGTFSGKIIKGDGMTTRLLKKNGLKVISEEDL